MQSTKHHDSANFAEIAGHIHRMLLDENYPAVVETLRQHVGTKNFMDLEQFFLIQYQYNYRTRFLHKADYEMCMKLSAVLNRRSS
jgi:hypothetical protein